MKVTEIEKNLHYKVRRTGSGERWPENWALACGLAANSPVSHLAFTDGDFIAEHCEVRFEPIRFEPKAAPLSRVMVQKWANQLPERMAISKFWEWMQRESHTFDQLSSGYNLEKVLDHYHGINREQLDTERQAMLDKLG